MRRVIQRSLPLLFIVLGVSGCNLYGPHLLTIRANYNVSRGDYQPAIVDYLRAEEAEQHVHWLAYNLGNVYHFLGESNAAMERWDYARASEMDELVFRATFNRGVRFLEQGRYRDAQRQFRRALELEPGSLPAKLNLELTLERISAETDLTGDITATNGQSSPAPTRGDDGVPAGSGSRMLDYMRRKEEQRWRANQETAVDPEIKDW